MSVGYTHIPPHRALTLIEVVVALGLGVVLLAAVQGLVLSAYRQTTAIEQRSSADAQHQLPFELLEADLSNRPAGAGLTLDNSVLTFRTLNAMQSTRVAPRHAVGVCYRSELTSDDHWQVTRTEQELDVDTPVNSGVILADHINSVTFEISDGRQWHVSWPLQTPRAARAVRLRVEWAAGLCDEQISRLAPLSWRRHDE